VTDLLVSGKHVDSEAPSNRASEPLWKARMGSKVRSPGITKGTTIREEKYRSPLDERSNQALSRKRPIEDSMAEVDEGPKRQKADSYQKEKRRAPKIASAYRSVRFLVSALRFLHSDPE
jgi:hypothetical protein